MKVETMKAIGTQTSLIYLNPLAVSTQTYDSDQDKNSRIYNHLQISRKKMI